MNDQRGGRDPELEDLFDSPADRQVGGEVRHFLRSVQEPPPEADPAFQRALRRRLLEEAWRRQRAPEPWHRRLLGARGLAAAGALAAALVVALVLATHRPEEGGVRVTSPLANAHTVSVVQPITLTFGQPMDPGSTQAAVAIEPATQVSYRWTSPETLQLVPAGGSLAPSTRYQVTVEPSARTSQGRPLAQEARISFVTGPPATTPTGGSSAGPTPAPSPSAAPTPSPSPSPTPEPSITPSPSIAPTAPASPPATPPAGSTGSPTAPTTTSPGSPGSGTASPPPARPSSG